MADRNESGTRFRTLVEASPEAVLIHTDGSIVYANPAAARLLAAPDAAHLTGRQLHDFGVPAQRGHGPSMAMGVAPGPAGAGDLRVNEAIWVRADGTEIHVHLTGTPMDYDGARAVLVVVRDMTPLVEARVALAVSEARFRSLAETSSDAIVVLDDDEMVTYASPALERVTGWRPEEIIGRSGAQIARTSGVDRTADEFAPVPAGVGLSATIPLRHRDGSVRQVEVTATNLHDHPALGACVLNLRDATERIEAQAVRQAADARFRALVQNASDLIITFGPERTVTYTSPAVTRLLGYQPDELVGLPGPSLLHPEDADAARRRFADVVAAGRGASAGPFSGRLRTANGGWREIEARITNLLDDPVVNALVVNIHDVTDRLEAERTRQAAETRFEIAFEQSVIGASVFDLAGCSIRVNPAVCALFARPEDQLVGREWTVYTHQDEVPLHHAVLAKVADGGDTYEDERRYLRPDGSVVWVSSHVTLVRDKSDVPRYFFAQLQDITERKRMEEDLVHQALHDALTGLPNRALLSDRLTQCLAGSQRRGSHLGVVFLDVDNFKVVNDSLGHACGDELLRHVAGQIAGAVRPGDTVARFGGDEFVVVCADVTVPEAQQIAGRVLTALSRPCTLEGEEISVTASVGIAVGGKDDTPVSLLRDADTAMYRAKDRGKGRVELFNEALRSRADRRFTAPSELRGALERGEFSLHYQPIVDLASHSMVSAEALLRWEHPTLGLIGPDQFVPLAEENGLIVPIGHWVLEESCRQLAIWQQTRPSMSVAVNLSAHQVFDPDIASLIEQALAQTGADPAGLCLELTESVFLDDTEDCTAALARFKSLGLQLSIDDFGTGYSSLSYLNRFPLDGVKVDRSFLEDLGTDRRHSALVAAIVAMATALGLEVTAEGVETMEQLVSLTRLGCHRAQGFYLERPLPEPEMSRLVAGMPLGRAVLG